jgi:16S rRNA (cytidine(1402)-2'-O)-methyltransferase
MAKLYLVPTPIGNLEDITLRALRILKEVDLILAEDTRTSKVLLNHFEIQTPLQSYHMHNEHQLVDRLVEKINAGLSVALISDAGTPGISDPGFLLIRACVEAHIETECLPGATAFVPALVQPAWKHLRMKTEPWFFTNHPINYSKHFPTLSIISGRNDLFPFRGKSAKNLKKPDEVH